MYFILAVVLATAFFAHEFVAIDNWKNTESGQLYLKQKKEALIALSELKKSSIGTESYKDYKLKADLRDETKKEVDAYINSVEFMGFKTFQQFVGEFGWALGLFIYSLFNLILVFHKKPKTFYAESILHTSLITVGVFFLRWSFNRGDFFVTEYLFYNALIVSFIVVSAYLFVSYKERAYNKLQNALNAISHFAFIGIKQFIHPDKMDEYKKESIETLKQGMEHER